jgi:dTDP-glucose 4,6-dehydratase
MDHISIQKVDPALYHGPSCGQQVPLYGNGLNVRDWIYVGDHVEGIDAVFHKGKSGEIYNLGGNNEMNNEAITNVLLRMGGFGEERIEHVADRLGHDFRYAIDS